MFVFCDVVDKDEERVECSQMEKSRLGLYR